MSESYVELRRDYYDLGKQILLAYDHMGYELRSLSPRVNDDRLRQTLYNGIDLSYGLAFIDGVKDFGNECVDVDIMDPRLNGYGSAFLFYRRLIN